MNEMNETTSFFREEQKLRQFWIWLIIIIIAGISWYAFVEQIVLKGDFGTNPAPDIVQIILWVVFGIIFPLFLPFTKLTTEVRNNGIYIQLFPFHLTPRRIDLATLKSYEVRKYKPIPEYGGWGIRKGHQGTAYNMSGNKGVQLELYNGKRILIGSQKPEELFHAIKKQIDMPH
ncbi:MAG: DUF6141 family protein [bacterium]